MTIQESLELLNEEIQISEHSKEPLSFFSHWLPGKLNKIKLIISSLLNSNVDISASIKHENVSFIDIELNDIESLSKRIQGGELIRDDVKDKYLESVKKNIGSVIRNFISDCNRIAPERLHNNIEP